MTAADLSTMSLEDLQSLKGTIEARILAAEKGRRAAAMTAAREAARAHGYALETLLAPTTGGKAPAARKSAKTATGVNPPRYAKPGDPGVTWTGRGRNPNWVLEHLKAGGALSDLAIS